MPFYLTRNPVPSADMRDVFDNAQNLDLALNNITSSIWTDRFGRSRMSWYGLESAFSLKLTDFETSFTAQLTEQANEFEAAQTAQEDSFQESLLKIGYEQLADYTDGPITFTRRNQITAYNGEFYRPKASVSLPYTTTGNTATTWEIDKDNFVAVGDSPLRSDLSGEYGLSYIGGVSSYSDLTELIPKYEGQRVKLSSWHEGYLIGCGEYTAVSGDFQDDGGVTARVNESWSWKLLTDTDKLTAANFGALSNEQSTGYDSTVAVQNYGLYLSSLPSPINGLPINFLSGTYNIANVDLSSTITSYPFRIKGAGDYEHGRQTPTMLNLTGDDGTYAFTVNSHVVDINNIGVSGGYDVAVNSRKFITSITRPTWLRVSKFYATYTGGVILDFLDTLDTKIDQFYTENTYDSFLRVLPSETASGGWTTTTSIELSNFNIQYHTGGSSAKPAILAPLSYYGVINNGWIEHSDYPANIAYGMWNINSLAIESTTYPVYAYMSRIRDVWGDYKLGTPIDYTLGAAEVAALNLTIPSWINDARFANAGIIEQPSYVINKGAEAHHILYPESRIAGANGWYYLGVFTPRYTAAGMVIELQGANGYTQDSTTKTTSIGAGSGTGKAIIRIQNKGSTSTPSVAWSNENSSGVTAVSWKYINSSSYQIAIYVKIQQYSNSIGVFVRSDSTTPTYLNGAESYYTFSGAAVSDITTVSGLISASAIHTIHNNTYGYGMNLNSGMMMFDTPVSYAEGASGQTRVLPIYNNGQRYNIPLSADGLRMPVYTKATVPAVSGTNYYSLIVITDGSTTSTPTVAWSNGTNWLRVSDNSIIS